MLIYGVALLSICLVTGMLFGELLGALLGVESNVGGVGIAMLLLLLVLGSNMKPFKAIVEGHPGAGIKFWSAMYIPIVVAMAAKQNVVAAFEGGILAVAVGISAVLVSFALVPVISRVGAGSKSVPDHHSNRGEGKD